VDPDRTDPRQLRNLDGHGMVLQDGDGEVLHIAQTPRDGARQVSRAAGGAFTERYDRYPAYFRIHTTGHVGRVVLRKGNGSSRPHLRLL
jgi:hypothetical protein